MDNSVVHFEIIATDPTGLRGDYAKSFGWEYQIGGPATAGVSEPGNTEHGRKPRRHTKNRPRGTPGTLVVGHFTDPEGHLIGVAGPA